MPDPLNTISQPPPLPPPVLPYAGIERKKDTYWIAVQSTLSLVLATVSVLVIFMYAVALVSMRREMASTQTYDGLAMASHLLGMTMPSLSVALWLRQRVARQRAAMEPVVPTTPRQNALHALSPWCLGFSGGVLIALNAAFASSYASYLNHHWYARPETFFEVQVYVIYTIGIICIVACWFILLARWLDPRRRALAIAAAPGSVIAAPRVDPDCPRARN